MQILCELKNIEEKKERKLDMFPLTGWEWIKLDSQSIIPFFIFVNRLA